MIVKETVLPLVLKVVQDLPETAKAAVPVHVATLAQKRVPAPVQALPAEMIAPAVKIFVKTIVQTLV